MGKKKRKSGDQTVYREFGSADEALERPVQELSPQEHDLRIQVSRKGRGGKTVTIVSGFQLKPETLKKLLTNHFCSCIIPIHFWNYNFLEIKKIFLYSRRIRCFSYEVEFGKKCVSELPY